MLLATHEDEVEKKSIDALSYIQSIEASRLPMRAARRFSTEMLKTMPDAWKNRPSNQRYTICMAEYDQILANRKEMAPLNRRMKRLLDSIKKKPQKPNTTIQGGTPECKHKFETWAYSRYVTHLKCKKCGAKTQRKTTSAERVKQEREDKIGMALHKTYHAFLRRFQDSNQRYKLKGYKFIVAMEKFCEKHKDIIECGVDDSSFAGSRLFFIPHDNGQEYMGTSVLYIPQCTGEDATEFFLYPGNLNELMDALGKIRKLTIKRNKRNGRKGQDY